MTDQQNIIENSSMLPVGTMLQGGKYRIDRYLSSGGFGNTYVVTNLYFEETCAMKEFFMKDLNLRDSNTVTVSMPDKRPLFEAHRDKFIKEARRLRKLHNKHLIQVHDLFEENGTAYYIMDFISGESLKTRMNRLGRAMTEEEVLPILRQAIDALDAIHREQIWHLDIKPDNIMIDAKGKLYLIDFGASKQLHTVDGYTLDTSLSMALTLGYAPLEQMEQNLRLCGPWTDLYALGATLYKMLTNYSIPSPTELLYGTQLTFPPTVSQRMQELINWMMKPIYSLRPQSAAEVRSFLGDDKNSGEKTIAVESDNNPAEETIIEEQVVNPTQEEKPIDLPVDGIVTVGNVSFKMIRVEGGTFMMGATPEQGSDANEDERPAHQVSLSTFYIGETEVTQELWKTVMGGNPSFYWGLLYHPVEEVSWDDCQDFIHKLNSLTGLKFRLPTEAEWEYAARGGQASCGFMYAGSNVDKDVAHTKFSKLFGKQSTIDVATKQPNELGLYDMSGNVWEWCQDWYGHYSSDSQSNPTGPSSGSYRVLRGGSWYSSPRYCRVSRRSSNSPSYCGNHIGLRLFR